MTTNVKDDYYDEVHRLDWSKNLDYDREWIKYIKQDYKNTLRFVLMI